MLLQEVFMQVNTSNGKDHSLRRTVISGIVVLVLTSGIYCLLFVCAGTTHWWQGWFYVIFTFLGSLLSRVLMARRNPDQIAERAQGLIKKDTKSFDRVLMPLIGIVAPLIFSVLAGFDKRFEWSPEFPLWVIISGIGLMVLAYSVTTWAMIVNRFFSSVVRIQKDRGHRVVTSGPYAVVRHPSYMVTMLAYFGMVMLLGSLWALIPAILVNMAYIARTSLEDRTLQKELPGYQEYSTKTRYRLFPGIW
jgi:protein-S-isoprenylcysteine O-methyltransferase Ste14